MSQTSARAPGRSFLRTLRDLFVFNRVNDGNLEEGSFRCDATSRSARGQPEARNALRAQEYQSFRYVQRAIDAEVARQTVIVDAGGTIKQETRSFDPDTGQTATLRSKEDAHDYRYFPEPDLPPLVIDEALLGKAKASMPESPPALRARWMTELGLPLATALTLSAHPEYARFFEARAKASKTPRKPPFRRERRATRRQDPWPVGHVHGHGRERATSCSV